MVAVLEMADYLEMIHLVEGEAMDIDAAVKFIETKRHFVIDAMKGWYALIADECSMIPHDHDEFS